MGGGEISGGGLGDGVWGSSVVLYGFVYQVLYGLYKVLCGVYNVLYGFDNVLYGFKRFYMACIMFYIVSILFVHSRAKSGNQNIH